MKKLIIAVIMLSITVFASSCGPKEKKEYRVAWSHYTGWEPWAYAE